MIDRRVIFPLLLPLLVGSLWADQVNLKNGDRVTGKIRKKDGASLIIKSDIFGSVTIPWDAVTQISSDEPIMVILPDGKSVLGKITTEESKVAVTTAASRESVAIAQVKAIRNAEEQKAYERLEHPGLLVLWDGYADLGASFAFGNSYSNTVTTAVKAARLTRTDKVGIYFNQVFSKGRTSGGTNQTTTNAVRGGWLYNRNFVNRAFLNLFNDYEFDGFQNLDLRFVVGSGAGYNAIKNSRMRLDLVGGADYSRENYSTPLTRNSAEMYWGNNFFHQFSKITALTQSFRMFNNLTTSGKFRVSFDVGQATQLRKWLSWQLTLSDRFLSNPVPGKKKNDVLLTTGVRFTFAH
jgi:hypothetical protein